MRLVQSPDDAADVVQDAFLNAYQSLRSFKGDAEFFTWLYRIAFNNAISLKRKKRPAVSLEAHAGEAGIDPDDPSEYVKPGAALERTEDERQLSEALGRLSPEHREVLLLKDIEGLRYEDIAVILAVPIGTIRSRLHCSQPDWSFASCLFHWKSVSTAAKRQRQKIQKRQERGEQGRMVVPKM